MISSRKPAEVLNPTVVTPIPLLACVYLSQNTFRPIWRRFLRLQLLLTRTL